MEQLMVIYDILEKREIAFDDELLCARYIGCPKSQVLKLKTGRLENIGNRFILNEKRHILTKIKRSFDGAEFEILNARSLGLFLDKKDSSKDRAALCLIKNHRAFYATIMGYKFSNSSPDEEKIKTFLNKWSSKRDKEKCKNYRESNKEFHIKRKKEWAKKNKDHVRKYNCLYTNKRRKKDASFRIRMNLRSRLKMALLGQTKSGSILSLIGCSMDFLKKYIENQFSPEMTWENYGIFWNIDHIIPCSFFDLSIEDHQRMCCFYKNLRPLSIKDNGKKLNKLPHDYRSFISDNLIEASLYPVTAYKLMLSGHANF